MIEADVARWWQRASLVSHQGISASSLTVATRPPYPAVSGVVNVAAILMSVVHWESGSGKELDPAPEK